jgi:large subunit ribosomal protein L15e
MSFAKRFAETLQKEYSGDKTKDFDFGAVQRQRLIDFRAVVESIVKLDKPSNLPRAHSLGYKAKSGFVVVRVRVRKGHGTRTRPSKGRRPKRMGQNKITRGISIRWIAEQRAAKKHPNCEVLNSYWVGEDGKHKYFEVILVDVNAPEIKADKEISWICGPQHRGRAERGLTSAARKSRGLRGRGKGFEKSRPSLRAHNRKAK